LIRKTNSFKIKGGLPTSVVWTGNSSFAVGNRLGIFSIFDTRCLSHGQSSVSGKDSGLRNIDVAAYCLENNMVAFGGNEHKIVLFDLRNCCKPLHTFSTTYSKLGYP
jgi:hypothetical protein